MYIKLLFILLLIFIIYIKIYYNNILIDEFDNSHLNIPVNLGNFLCVYFYSVGYSFLKNEQFQHNGDDKMFFIKDLPRKIDIDKNIIQKLLDNNFTIDELDNEVK